MVTVIEAPHRSDLMIELIRKLKPQGGAMSCIEIPGIERVSSFVIRKQSHLAEDSKKRRANTDKMSTTDENASPPIVDEAVGLQASVIFFKRIL